MKYLFDLTKEDWALAGHYAIMKTSFQLVMVAAIWSAASVVTPLFAQGTAFTYQGRLKDGGGPADGSYDLKFTLFGVSSGGSALGGSLTNSPTGVTNGLFTVTLDFGNEFPGAARWLEIGVRTNGGGAFTDLSPRQEITSTPYAIQSVNAASAVSVSGSVSSAQLTGTISSNNIGAGSITTVMLAAGSVGSNQLANGAVTSDKVATVSNWIALTLTNPTPAIAEFFGAAVAAVGTNLVLIGAPSHRPGVDDVGAAYLFSTDGALLTTFTNPTPAGFDLFGVSVAGVGTDRVLIGARFDDTSATDAGSAYLFSTNGALLTTFTNPTPALSDFFAEVVAGVGTDWVLIGALSDDAGTTDAGAAYLFSTNGALVTTFTNPTPASGDFFGAAVAGVGTDRVLIGAFGDNAHTGVAYLFSTNGALVTTFTNPTPAAFDSFGTSVAGVWTDRVLIGAYGDDASATDAGVAHLFSLETYTPGLVADRVNPRSITSLELQDGAVTLAKLDPTIGVWTRAGDDVFRLSGNVGIGTNSFSGNRLQVLGSVGATAFNTTSDRAAKQDFTAVDAQGCWPRWRGYRSRSGASKTSLSPCTSALWRRTSTPPSVWAPTTSTSPPWMLTASRSLRFRV